MHSEKLGPSDALPAGTRIGGYTIEGTLGQGGFGIVYRGRQRSSDVVVAIKEYMPTELAFRAGRAVQPRSGEAAIHFEECLKRFRDEAIALLKFRHYPNIVTIRDFLELNGTAYLIMEYVDGVTLSTFISQRERSGKPFVQSELLRIAIPIAEGLEYIHSANILHRDIKPSNILIRLENERPVLIDFGAMKHEFAGRTKSMAPYTPGYAALEQVANGQLGPWTDIYSFGAVLWRILAGQKRPSQNDGVNPPTVESRAAALLSGKEDPMQSALKLAAGTMNKQFLLAIDHCLKVRSEHRIKNGRDLLGILRTLSAADSLEVTHNLNGRVARGTVLQDRPYSPRIVVIPSGSYRMGSPASELGHVTDEAPLHFVEIPYELCVGVFPVTFSEWDACVESSGCKGYSPDDLGWGRGRRPVINVSWEDAQAYCDWLTEMTGYKYRLLTESEWEYVARAGSGSRFHFGESISELEANYSRMCGGTVEVGRYSPNEFGLYDVHGNVWEWTQDKYHADYAMAPIDGTAWDDGTSQWRVLRGGAWTDPADGIRSAVRNRNRKNCRSSVYGFRVARQVAP